MDRCIGSLSKLLRISTESEIDKKLRIAATTFSAVKCYKMGSARNLVKTSLNLELGTE